MEVRGQTFRDVILGGDVEVREVAVEGREGRRWVFVGQINYVRYAGGL